MDSANINQTAQVLDLLQRAQVVAIESGDHFLAHMIDICATQAKFERSVPRREPSKAAA